MRRYGRTDANQTEVVEELKQSGVSVVSLASLGGGVTDLLCGHEGLNWLFELKTPGGRLTPLQKKWLDEWRGQADVAETTEEILRRMGLL